MEKEYCLKIDKIDDCDDMDNIDLDCMLSRLDDLTLSIDLFDADDVENRDDENIELLDLVFCTSNDMKDLDLGNDFMSLYSKF